MFRAHVLAALLVLALLAPLHGFGQQPKLKDVLAHAGAYVEKYGDALSAVVAREEYTQRVTQAVGASRAGEGGRATTRERVLLSEFALVRVTGNAPGWEGFRDVFQVDGAPVHDRQNRLERLFTESPGTALQRARTIADESARFNIGPIARNFNVPTAVLFFLHPSNQPRFRFRADGAADVDGRNTWIVRFDERDRPTLIRTPTYKDVPAKGRLWIEPDTGRVLRTELTVSGFASGAAKSTASISVDFRLDQGLGLWVPGAMREEYATSVREDDLTTTIATTTGVAKYSNYRRFATDARMIVPK